ncbi:MAG TPA: NAD/NADP octopine/nopaline dehydrogenase family protein [Bacilli bacterium]|nr:NAD/NADP octopine/nopaline dehydrogenase family protein [Bacilli bacterium]HQM06643.1 NAD/NADP octopine/nopaline dehydrogenase family protein [Bacilli bacterium]
MKNITIIGGGNMGSILSVKFSQKNNVTLFLNNSKKLDEYSKNMKIFNEDSNTYVTGKIAKITDNLEDAVKDAEWIYVTFPPFLFENLSKDLVPLLKAGQHLVGIPGSGGFELFFKDALVKGVTITGLQRVHSVARIIERGREVRESGVRKNIRCASIPMSFNKEAAEFISNCYSLPVDPLDNYLNITLINSNPILHTSRLYTIFKDFETVKEYDSLPLFYEEWSLESSELLEKMDKELFTMMDELTKNGMVVNEITTLLEHYESKNAIEMTRKLNSINSLKGLSTPSIKNDNGKWIPDLKSRYFTADFPLGLDILLSFSSVLNIPTPNLLMVSNWYHKITNTPRSFTLKRFGFNDIDDLKTLYSL